MARVISAAPPKSATTPPNDWVGGIFHPPPGRAIAYGMRRTSRTLAPPPPHCVRGRSAQGPILLSAHPPDRAVAVLGHQERAVMRDRDADRSAPDVGVACDKPGHEVLIFTGRHAILEAD